LFPAITAGVSVYALFANAATISKHLSIAADIVPAGTLDLLGEEMSVCAALGADTGRPRGILSSAL
jgi:membrane protein